MANPALDREVDQAVAHGSELLKQGKLDEAQQTFRAALQLDGENARVLALLGLTYFRAGQFTQARPIYEELVERAPTDASHRLNLGLVYLKLDESDKAIGSLEASRALDPSQGRAVSYLGLAYARAGRYAEAYRSFLLAGQNELASEIEFNLTPAERDGIQAQLARAAVGVEPRTRPPKEPPQPTAPDDRSDEQATDIAIQVPPVDEDSSHAAGHTSMPEISFEALAEAAEKQDAVPSRDPDVRVTESAMFVLPTSSAVPMPTTGQSMISKAVEIATPAAAISSTSTRVGPGSVGPIALSQLATDLLVRPDAGEAPFEVTAGGALVIRVSERVLTRLDGVYVTGGQLTYEPSTRRSRGHQTEEKFDFGGTRLHVVTGNGHLIAVPGDKTFTAVSLDDDIFYLREDLVFAFESSLRWENGNVPGLRGKLPVVQFRGDGAVAMHTAQPLVRVKLPAQGVLLVAAMRLAGWIGRVIPRAVVPPNDGPMGEVCVECTGEGVVLIDPAATPVVTADRARRPSRIEPLKNVPPPAPQPPGGIAELDLGLDSESPNDEM